MIKNKGTITSHDKRPNKHNKTNPPVPNRRDSARCESMWYAKSVEDEAVKMSMAAVVAPASFWQGRLLPPNEERETTQ